jgi:hypothetical protein
VELADYRKIFKEIIQGCTKAAVGDNIYYIKHLTAHDQVDIDEINDKYYQQAIDRGIPTEKEVLKDLEKDGQWTHLEEKQIEKLEVFIEQLQKNKSALVLKSEINRQNQSIAETRAKINALQEKKSRPSWY